MLKRNQKEAIVKEIADNIKDSKSVIFIDYKGLEVNDMNALRKQLREAGISLKVIKKSLATIALKEAGLDKNVKDVEGQIAVALGKDEIEGAKILSKFAKDNENVKVMVGFIEKKELTIQEISNLAKLPGREELLAKLVGSLNAPVSGFVNVLGGNLRGLVNVLKAVSDQKA